MLKILLQIFIFSIFIVSNCYQSLVTSFMLVPVQETSLKSVNELLDSDLNISYSLDFDNIMKDHPKYQKADRNGRVVHIDAPFYENNWQETLIQNGMVYEQPCKIIKQRIENQGDGKSWRGIYQISQVAYSKPEDLFIAPFHPNLEKFQEIMDYSFQAGLHQAWERFYWEIYEEEYNEKKERAVEKDILDFDSIIPFFGILAVGFSFAFIALLCEIFF